MIGGQTLITNSAEESFISVQNKTGLVENTETVGAITETVPLETAAQQVDLRVKFARLKKAMRKRSVSIF